MLGLVALVEQFRAIESGLPGDWADARLVLTLDDASRAERASAVLSSFAPGRVGSQVRFSLPRRGGRLEQARRLFGQLDRERITGELELLTTARATLSSAARSCSGPSTPRATEARSGSGSAWRGTSATARRRR